MIPVTLTLSFDSLDDLYGYLSRAAKDDPRQTTIAFADRPDVGVEAAPSFKDPVPPFPTPFNPFAGAAVAQVPPPPAAPSTAAVAAPSIAPAVPTPTSTAAAPVPPAPAPTPAAEATAPAAPAAPTSLAGIVVDVDGLPWDARIHAGGRAQNADGRWRQKRGLNDAALKARVEAELRQAMGAPAVASVPVPPPPAAVATAPTPAAPVASPTEVPTAPSDPAAETFPAFMARVGGAMVAGAITQGKMTAVLSSVGLTSVAQLALRPDLLPAVSAALA